MGAQKLSKGDVETSNGAGNGKGHFFLRSIGYLRSIVKSLNERQEKK